MQNNKQVTPSVYSDFVDISFNLYNFTIYFGSIEDNVNQLMGKIKMSPETAKAFRDALDKNIKIYEEIYGEINVFTEEVRKKEQDFREKNMSKKNENKKEASKTKKDK